MYESIRYSFTVKCFPLLNLPESIHSTSVKHTWPARNRVRLWGTRTGPDPASYHSRQGDHRVNT